MERGLSIAEPMAIGGLARGVGVGANRGSVTFVDDLAVALIERVDLLYVEARPSDRPSSRQLADYIVDIRLRLVGLQPGVDLLSQPADHPAQSALIGRAVDAILFDVSLFTLAVSTFAAGAATCCADEPRRPPGQEDCQGAPKQIRPDQNQGLRYLHHLQKASEFLQAESCDAMSDPGSDPAAYVLSKVFPRLIPRYVRGPRIRVDPAPGIGAPPARP